MDHSKIHSIRTSYVPPTSYKKVPTKSITKESFSAQLQSALNTNSNLLISKHAQQRLHQRNIQITEANWSKIGQKVSEARKMGITDSLVLLPNAALIVSAKNQTVITAMDRNEASSQIFTNINGTIVLE